MHRFYLPLPAPPESGGLIVVTGEAAHQLGRVLRVRPGDDVALFDGSGAEYRARVTSVGRARVVVEHVETTRPETELRSPLVLAMALIQHARFELVVQKATELGATAIQPVVFERSHSSGAARVGADRLARWREVAREAAEQSGRVRLPDVRDPLPYARLLDGIDARDALLFHPRAGSSPPGAQRSGRVSVLIVGPEGGLTDTEVALAWEAGVGLVALGCRIMRAETAAIAALTLEVAAREAWIGDD